MIPAAVLLGAVTAERLAELWLARRNTTDLLVKGAREFAPSHYPAIVLLHAFWLAGLWFFGWMHPLSSFWLMIFLVLQALRVWILMTLGHRWTTRIIDVP
jgi:methyltransferase